MGKDVIALMLQEYERFTRSERKIADYVLDHQEETQYISITDLSGRCGVAVSTVSLFCRKLKLAGFNDFKLELAPAARPPPPPPPPGPHRAGKRNHSRRFRRNHHGQGALRCPGYAE